MKTEHVKNTGTNGQEGQMVKLPGRGKLPGGALPHS